MLDDLQWMPAEEIQYWSALLDGHQPLDHVLLISTYRVQEENERPSPEALLSTSTVTIHVPALSDEGVNALLRTVFHNRLESSFSLASFLYAETAGSSYFVRSLISSLVRDRVIMFDFKKLMWYYDPIELQRHLSKSGIDAYLEQIIKSQTGLVQRVLLYLSCLPARGFTIPQLGELVDSKPAELEHALTGDVHMSMLLVKDEEYVRFVHEGPRSAAYRCLGGQHKAAIHLKVSQFLRKPEFGKDFVYEAADHALSARDLGANKEPDEELVELLLEACSRTALSTRFNSAKRFLDAAQGESSDARARSGSELMADIMIQSGGHEVWLKEHRALSLRFLKLTVDASCVTQSIDEATIMVSKLLHVFSNAQIQKVEPYLEGDAEKIRIAGLSVRLRVAGEYKPPTKQSVGR